MSISCSLYEYPLTMVVKTGGKKIKAAQKDHKAALKAEEKDNARYYAVITNDPATMDLKKKKADRNL